MIVQDKGWPKKDLTKMGRSLCLVSLATNMLKGWDIIHWKGGIHSFVGSTKTFLYDIWEPRYEQIKMGYQISKWLNIGQSQCLKIRCPIMFYFISAPLCFTELSACFIWMSSLKWDMSQPSKMIIARETMHKSQQYQISRH